VASPPDPPAQGEREPERAERILAERARRLAAPPPGAAEDVFPAVAFDAGEERYAIAMEHVLRVERASAVARLPGAPPEVLGVTVVEGRPCPLVDPPALLGGVAPAGAPRRWVVVLGRRGPELGLAADAVDVVSVERGKLHPARAPRLGTMHDARLVLDGAALVEGGAPGREPT
jgi:purine-binding chemotaxis protein CheW